MREFFHGWRRKVGCVSLVMAGVLMAGWVRSRILLDVVSFTVEDEQHQIATVNGFVFWGSWTLNEIPPRIPQNRWYTVGFERYEPADRMIQMQYLVAFVYGNFDWVIPYWQLVLPLTLLSAYLILWKPRKRVKRDA